MTAEDKHTPGSVDRLTGCFWLESNEFWAKFVQVDTERSAADDNPTLARLSGMDLAEHDDTLPNDIVEGNRRGNETVLSNYRAQARIRRRVAAMAMLRTAWRRSHGRPAVGDETQSARSAKLAHMHGAAAADVSPVRGDGEGDGQAGGAVWARGGGVPMTLTSSSPFRGHQHYRGMASGWGGFRFWWCVNVMPSNTVWTCTIGPPCRQVPSGHNVVEAASVGGHCFSSTNGVVVEPAGSKSREHKALTAWWAPPSHS